VDKRQRQLVDVAKTVDVGRKEHLSSDAVQDNLWGQITLDAHAARVLQTAPMRRLRSITQLGFVDRIWNEATHTRYDHSRGSYHVARQVMTQLHDPVRSLKKWALSQKQFHTFLLAALLHDVGHYPFSHSLDGLRSLLPAHEQVSRMLIEQSELATILERDCHLSPARIADLIDPPLHPQPLEEHTLLYQLLSGACDVDKLDYVARDALACRYASPTPTNSESEVAKQKKEGDTFFQGKTRRKESSS
jgi:HD superfamily phosphohydrolase